MAVVLSHDVFACPEERIKDATPVLTMVGGDVVWERPEPPGEETERS